MTSLDRIFPKYPRSFLFDFSCMIEQMWHRNAKKAFREKIHAPVIRMQTDSSDFSLSLHVVLLVALTLLDSRKFFCSVDLILSKFNISMLKLEQSRQVG